MRLEEYQQHDAVSLAALVRAGDVTPAELLDTALAAVDAVNPSINAVVRRMDEEARAVLETGPPVGPFTGVPFLLKDLRASYAGVPTTSGSAFFADAVAPEDSETVRRLKDAGTVIFGKTNTPEFGGSPSTEPRLFGPTRNPWDLDHSAGGSSGGSAAAVAAGIVPAAHGSDGGGSVRIPAGCCGLFGFKPTRARIPSGPDRGDVWFGLSSEGIISRTVRDTAGLLDAVCGPASGDPYVAPPLPGTFTEQLDQSPGRLRIAVQRTSASGAPVDAACLGAVDDVADLLADLGHEVVEAAPTYDTASVGPAFMAIIITDVTAAIEQRAEAIGRDPGPDDLEPVVAALVERAKDLSATDAARAVWACHQAGRDVAPFFAEHDVLLSPTVATPPPPLGHLDTTMADLDEYLARVFSFIPFTSLFNIAGLPGMNVPLVWSDAGLPIGTHLGAGFGRDAVLMRLAAQLEQTRPWADRRPPVNVGA